MIGVRRIAQTTRCGRAPRNASYCEFTAFPTSRLGVGTIYLERRASRDPPTFSRRPEHAIR